MAERYWTVGEANDSLARVGAMVGRAKRLAVQVQSGGDPMAARANGNRHRAATDPRAELRQILEELDADGILLRDIERGLIDFAAHAPGGHEYWLCWLVGEPDVAWWHWPEDGFAGRTSVDELPT